MAHKVCAPRKGSARVLEVAMTSCTPKPFDMWLKETLCQDFNHPGKGWQSNLRQSCYISPPLGGLYEHETDIVGPGQMRPSLFGAHWGQEGSVGAVRPTDKPRVLMGLAERTGQGAEGQCGVSSSTASGYLSDDGTDTYWGPPYTAGEGWKRGQHGEWWWTKNYYLQALREHPDESEVPAPPDTLKLTRLGLKGSLSTHSSLPRRNATGGG